MKPNKNAVAVVIKNERGEFMIVKRPDNEDGPLAGIWGFPAVSRSEDESEEAAVIRVGRVKLGIRLKPLYKIGERVGDRGTYTLHLSDYAAEILGGEAPTVPQADTSITQYTTLQYTSDPAVLLPAARRGSLCSQVYLQSVGIDWTKPVQRS